MDIQHEKPQHVWGGYHHGSIARELKRFSDSSGYKAESAQEDYSKKRLKSKPHGKWNADLSGLVVEKLKDTWSPEQISHTVTVGKLSFKTYTTGCMPAGLKLLPRKYCAEREKGEAVTTLLSTLRALLFERDLKRCSAEKHSGIGNLIRLFLSEESAECFATFAERKTRLYTAIPIPNRTAASMESAIKRLYAILPRESIKTATTDRDGEFACYDNIKKDLGLTLYFADPYCPHQRGTNEYSNGLLREFFQKTTDLGNVSQEKLSHSLSH